MSLPAYPSYKDSGVPWLGQVPAHWEVKKLKALCGFLGGGTPSTENSDYWDGDIPWVSAKDMKREFIDDTEDHITEAGIAASAASLIPIGSVLLVVRSGILKHTIPVAINTSELTVNQDMRALVFGETTLPVFFLRWVQGFQDDLLTAWRKQGATVESIEFSHLANTTIPLPPLAEQQAIAAWLDERTGRIDEAVAAQRTLLEQLKEKRRALIAHAVTRGLDPAAPLKDSGIEWLGLVPQHWEVKKIKYVTVDDDGIKIGPFGGSLMDLDREETGYKVYGQENTISGDLAAGSRWLSKVRFEELEKYQVVRGDILLTRKGSLGNAYLVECDPPPGIIDSDTIRVRVNTMAVGRHYLTLLLHEAHYISEQIASNKRGAILAGVNSETISNLVIVLPPLAEQQAIAAYLDAETAKLDTLTAETEKTIALLQEHRTALIAEAVTGKLKVA